MVKKTAKEAGEKAATLVIDVESFVRTRDSVSCFLSFIPRLLLFCIVRLHFDINNNISASSLDTQSPATQT